MKGQELRPRGRPLTPAQTHCHCRRVFCRFHCDSEDQRAASEQAYLLLSALRACGESCYTGQLQELRTPKHEQALRHRPPGFRSGEGQRLCVLFQSSKLLGLGSPLSADHSATLMATWTLKFYSELPGRSGRRGWRKCLLALLCSAGGHAAILLLHKRLLQVPVWQWPLDHWSIMIAG